MDHDHRVFDLDLGLLHPLHDLGNDRGHLRVLGHLRKAVQERVSKVFLVDAAGLPGLYRVASFLGLGLCLITFGYLYQRFVLIKRA